jgi:hypothetical protein
VLRRNITLMNSAPGPSSFPRKRNPEVFQIPGFQLALPPELGRNDVRNSHQIYETRHWRAGAWRKGSWGYLLRNALFSWDFGLYFVSRYSFNQRRTPSFGWDAEPLTGTIGADRPGFSTSPETVLPGRLQIEGGYQFTTDRGVDSHSMPLLLIRAGLTKKLEARVSWEGLPGRKTTAASNPKPMI